MNDRILQRIQALLALAKSSNEHEAQAAATEATRLMMKHRLSEADVADAASAKEPIGYHEPLYAGPRRCAWKDLVGQAIALANGCRTASWRTERGYAELRILGRSSDVTVVRHIFTWVTLAAERLVRKTQPPTQLARLCGVRKWRSSWLRGFANGLEKQLLRVRAEVRAEAVSTALVRVNGQDAEVEKAFRATPGLRTITYSSRSVASAFREGEREGESLHLGKTIGTPSPKLLTRLPSHDRSPSCPRAASPTCPSPSSKRCAS